METEVFADSSWGNGDQRKSIGGHILMIGRNLIAWQCKQQAHIAASSAEAEYIQAAEAVKHMRFYRQQIAEMWFNLGGPTIWREDNEACIAIATGGEQFRPRTKHFDIRMHMVRDAYSPGQISISHVAHVRFSRRSIKPPS